MKKILIRVSLVLGSLYLLGNFSYGQAAYAGSYTLVSGYTSHFYSSNPYKGTFGMGVLTIRSTGAASYTASFNFNGYDIYFKRIAPFTGSGTGRVTSLGSFNFNNGVTGSGVITGTRVGAFGGGTFRDLVGNGIWFVSRYR